MIEIPTVYMLWILMAGASICAYMIGRHMSLRDTDLVIENTIKFLVENELVKWKYDENGEIELLPLDEKNHT